MLDWRDFSDDPNDPKASEIIRSEIRRVSRPTPVVGRRGWRGLQQASGFSTLGVASTSRKAAFAQTGSTRSC